MQISIAEYERFRSEYYGGPLRITMRFGQAFMNRYVRDEPNPYLYYMENNKEAGAYIVLNYVDLLLEENTEDKDA